MAPTPGTLPFYPPYQPGSLPLTGQEILYLVNSATATAAASYRVLLTDVVGKAPSVMPGALPVANDILAFYQVSSNTPRSTSVANFMTLQGNVASGGTVGQVYTKNSATNFDAGWTTTLPFLTLGTTTISGIATTGGLAVNTVATIASLAVTTATATNITATNGTVTTLVATNLTVQNLSANSLTAGGANITSLTVTNATVTQNLSVATALAVGTSMPSAGIVNASTAVQVNGFNLSRMLLTTLAVNGLASAVITAVGVAGFSTFIVEINGVSPNTNTTALQMQVATSGTTFVSGGYVSMTQTNVSSILTTDTSTTVMLLSGTRATTSLSNSTSYGFNSTFQIRRNSENTPHVIRGSAGYLSAGASGTTTVAMADFVGYLDVAFPLTAISIAPAAGTFTAVGNIKVYGLL